MKKLILTLVLAATFSSQPAFSAEMDASPVVKHYASLVYANYEDALNAAKAMQSAINAFLASPNAATQQAAQQAWRACRTC